jgi:hypothetical protein
MGLGRAYDDPTVNFGDCFDDLDPAPGQVDPAGGQGHELAPAQAGVGQDSDERLIGHTGVGQHLYLIMSEEALGRRHNAGEGYALGDVPDEPSVADGRCELQRKDAVGVPDGCGASPSSVRPCTQLETSEWVIRDGGTSSQRGRIWRRSATSERTVVVGFSCTWSASQRGSHSPTVILERVGSIHSPRAMATSCEASHCSASRLRGKCRACSRWFASR